MTTKQAATTPELELAAEILQPIVIGEVADVVSERGDVLRFRIRSRFGWKLSAVVFSRDALRRLLRDPLKKIKIEYLQRDIVRCAGARREYRYPHMRKNVSPVVAWSLAVLP